MDYAASNLGSVNRLDYTNTRNTQMGNNRGYTSSIQNSANGLSFAQNNIDFNVTGDDMVPDWQASGADPFTDYIFRSLQQGNGFEGHQASAHHGNSESSSALGWADFLANFSEPLPLEPPPAGPWPNPGVSEADVVAQLPSKRMSVSSSLTQNLNQGVPLNTESESGSTGMENVQP